MPGCTGNGPLERPGRALQCGRNKCDSEIPTNHQDMEHIYHSVTGAISHAASQIGEDVHWAADPATHSLAFIAALFTMGVGAVLATAL